MRMTRSRLNELRFYIIFFVIFLLISSFGASQMMQQERSSGTMPITGIMMPAIVQLGLIFLITCPANGAGNSLSDIVFKPYS